MEAIEVNDLVKFYKQKLKKVKALDKMSFFVKKGEICGFLGPNGAGKSTTLKIIMDFIRADEGDVFINGINSKRVESKKKIGFMPENPPYIDSFTGRELLLFSCRMHQIDINKKKKKIDELLELFELSSSADKKLRNYSKGMIQRIGFAATLIIEPEILILDEPMSGLDPMGRYIFKNELKKMKEKGATIFFSSHIISDIEDICDRVIIVDKGKVIKTIDEHELKLFSIEGYKLIIEYSEDRLEGYVCEYLKESVRYITVKKQNLVEIIDKLKNKSIKIISIEPIRKSLEEIFVNIIKK